jgi:hypothetical protein
MLWGRKRRQAATSPRAEFMHGLTPAPSGSRFEELLADRLRVLGPGIPATRHNLACWRDED